MYSISFAAIALTACNSADDLSDYYSPSTGNGGISGNNSTSETSATVTGLTDFDVALNTASLDESETVPSGNEDYIENVTLPYTLYITYSGTGTATTSGSEPGEVTVSGGDVTVNATAACRYVLQGSCSNGSLTITSSDDVAIELNGVTLTNPDGAVVNVQSKVRTYIVATDGTTSTLTDGSRSSDDAKVKGAVYTKGKAILSGAGSLVVNGNYKNGIDAKKSLIIRPNTNTYVTLCDTITKGACIKCENETSGEGLYVLGGVINLSNPSAAGKGLASDGDITVSGGRLTAICTGAGVWDEDDLDVSGAAGIKCDSTFLQSGGDIWIKSTGTGGKGINGDATLTFGGGTAHILTTGALHTYKYNGYTYDTSPKGIKTDGDVYVTGGEIYVRATGATEGSEGIEAKQSYNQTGGAVQVYAADDALNAGYSSEGLQEKKQMGIDVSGLTANAGQINISGGTLYAYSTSNDAVDANGYITVSGGTVVAFGADAPETSFDCDSDNRFTVTGGTLFGMGGAAPNTPGASCTQCFAVSSFSPSANTQYSVAASDGTAVITVTIPRSYNGGSMAVSSPTMQKGTTYTIGNTSFTTSTSSWITNSSQGGGMGGNTVNPGNPGNWGGNQHR